MSTFMLQGVAISLCYTVLVTEQNSAMQSCEMTKTISLCTDQNVLFYLQIPSEECHSLEIRLECSSNIGQLHLVISNIFHSITFIIFTFIAGVAPFSHICSEECDQHRSRGRGVINVVHVGNQHDHSLTFMHVSVAIGTAFINIPWQYMCVVNRYRTVMNYSLSWRFTFLSLTVAWKFAFMPGEALPSKFQQDGKKSTCP